MRILTKVFLAAAMLSAAATTTWAVDTRSGFLEDLPALGPDADNPGASIWLKPGLDLAKYDKIAVDQIEIFLDPASPYKGVSPDDLKAVADAMYQTFKDVLEPDYALVGKTGPGVLFMRIAVTNVHVKKKKRGLLGYTPIGLAVTTAQDLAGKRISLKNATFETEALDGASGERLGVLVTQVSGVVEKKDYSWGAVLDTSEFYSKRFRGRLDAAHKP